MTRAEVKAEAVAVPGQILLCCYTPHTWAWLSRETANHISTPRSSLCSPCYQTLASVSSQSARKRPCLRTRLFENLPSLLEVTGTTDVRPPFQSSILLRFNGLYLKSAVVRRHVLFARMYDVAETPRLQLSSCNGFEDDLQDKRCSNHEHHSKLLLTLQSHFWNMPFSFNALLPGIISKIKVYVRLQASPSC
jgi:hypothetical protein